MRWLLDSNVWIEALNKEPHAARALHFAGLDEWCGYSAMSRLELLSFSGLTAENIAAIRDMLIEYVEVPVSDEVIEEAARLRRMRRMKTPDAIIAATALLAGATLLTRNVTDFDRIPGLSLHNSESF